MALPFAGIPRLALRFLLGLACLGLACLGKASAKSPEEFLGNGSHPAPRAAPDTSKRASPPKTAAAAAPASSNAKVTPGKAAPLKPQMAKTAMDTAKLHAIYLDGDFDQAIKSMEKALKSKAPLTHADSVFIFKHLGVMYAATPATREKGRYYMAQLIYIEPTAKILDMYASDMIYLIFRNVQEEFENRHPDAYKKPLAAADTLPKPLAVVRDTVPAPRLKAKSNAKYWITGGAVVAVGTVGLLYVLLDDPKPKQHNIIVPE